MISLAMSLDPKAMHPGLRKFAEFSISRDERYGLFQIDPNTMTEEFPGYSVDLGTPLSIGKFTLVYGVLGPSNIVIKYKNDCEQDTGDLHPLLRDSWFSSIANRLYPMGPKVRFISPPIPLPERPTRKLSFRMSRDAWQRCRNRNGTVRFLVEDRILGLSMTEYKQAYAPGGMNMLESVSIISHLLKYLEILHSNGIIHGNVNADNVMISGPNDGTEGLHLIDFSKAFFDDQIEGEDEPSLIPIVTDPLASPWELQSLRKGMRDDVYRALDLLVRMINGRAWSMNFDMINRMGSAALLSWRLNGSIFELHGTSPFRANVLGVSETTVQAVRKRFTRIFEIVLELQNVNMIPPYSNIQQYLTEIHDLLSGKRIAEEPVRPFRGI